MKYRSCRFRRLELLRGRGTTPDIVHKRPAYPPQPADSSKLGFRDARLHAFENDQTVPIIHRFVPMPDAVEVPTNFSAQRAVEIAVFRGRIESAMRASVFAMLALFASPLAVGKDALPRVIILGDSVYQQPSQQAANLLKGQAEIVCSDMKSGEVFHTTTALGTLGELLGEGKWDLIHFNFGLGDLVYRAPGMKSFRVMSRRAGGVRATGPADYEKNLVEIVRRLKGTGAKLVWASTTPIRSDADGIFEAGSEVEYNIIAAKVMTVHGVTINNMHAAVSSLLEKSKAGTSSPFSFGKHTSIHQPIVHAICRELGLAVPLEARTSSGRAPRRQGR